jgi:hypothetical protein
MAELCVQIRVRRLGVALYSLPCPNMIYKRAITTRGKHTIITSISPSTTVSHPYHRFDDSHFLHTTIQRSSFESTMQSSNNSHYPQASMAGNITPKPFYPVAQTQAYHTPTQRPANPQTFRPQPPLNPNPTPNYSRQPQTLGSLTGWW